LSDNHHYINCKEISGGYLVAKTLLWQWVRDHILVQ